MSKLIGKSLTIIGGSGYTGTAIAREALKLGIKVNSISRSTPETNFNPSLYKSHALDIYSADSHTKLSNILESSDAIVHLIGTLFEKSSTGQGSYDFMNKQSAIIVSTLLNSLPSKKKLVYYSAHKNFPFYPKYLTTKREAEEHIKKCENINSVIMRPGMIYSKLERPFSFPLFFVTKAISTFYSPLVKQIPNTEMKYFFDQLNYDKSIELSVLAKSTILASFFDEYDGRILENEEIENIGNNFIQKVY